MDKTSLRTLVLSKRNIARVAADNSIAANCADLARGLPLVAAYSPQIGEPGGSFLLQTLAQLTTVVLPVTTSQGLQWRRYTGSLNPGKFGIGEPTGEEVSLAHCHLQFVPALAFSRAGIRLGRGGGYYDRALANSSVPRAGVVYAEEVFADIPHEPHDLSVQWIITEEGTTAALTQSN
ncbi:5-formyltetrahydrofolate cyclo-ligase [Corynebacterium caspium]|uniref:5-formyltetrahydrofolate cyclo-ligase n=1 Tax=Corynebacterium caspium TaxID=234828 RepID=UPI0014616E4D|nr:5-formyltetrahydrofolate cyclo-ligase [Corynebacterium caspium]WKD59622.1 5-formyltetrahydrofolate cyclo-ligase family protein [Corynebacterium caspium DSM 44850]